MYQIGDKVIYGLHGACVIIAEDKKIIGGQQVTYLVLEPEGQSGSRYLVPQHNPVAMAKVRRLMDREELDKLLTADDIRYDVWIPDESRRKLRYRELLAGADRHGLIQMVFTLYHHRKELSTFGKRLHMCDENFLRDSEKILSGEIAAILGVSSSEAKQYLRKMLKEDA